MSLWKRMKPKKVEHQVPWLGGKVNPWKPRCSGKWLVFQLLENACFFVSWRFFFISSLNTVSKIFAIYVTHQKRVFWFQTSLWERMKPNKVEHPVLWWPTKVNKSQIKISSKKLDLAWKSMFFDEVVLVGWWS